MNAITTEQPKKHSIREYLAAPSMLEQIGRALPQHMTAERMARIATTCLARVPKLAECTPESFFRCLLDLSAWGLEPDGRHAHLIPYGKECTLVLDYKGIVALAYRSEKILSIHCDVIREGDMFEFSLGEVKQHTPWAFRNEGKPTSAGEIVGAYAYIKLVNGAIKCELMSRDEIEAIRKRSRAGNSGPWVTDFAEMGKKTVFRRASKWIPLSAEIVQAFERDDEQFAVSQPIKADPIDIAGLIGGNDE